MSSFIRIDGPPEFCRSLAAAIAETLRDRLDDIRLLDAGQAAQVLGVTVPTFRNIADREKIPSVDFGERNARWSINDLRELKKKREVKG